jgi:hypothetical protein
MSGGGDDSTSTQQTTTQIPAWMDTAGQNAMGQAGDVLANNQYNPLQMQSWATAGGWGSMAPGAFGQAYNAMSGNANYQANNSWLAPLAGMLGGGGGFGTGLGMSGGGGSGGAYNVEYDPAAIAQLDMSQLERMNPRSFLDYNVADYSNPYTTNVIDAQLGDMERSRQLTTNSNAARAIGSGAFGGSRSGIVDAVTNSEYDRNSQQASAQMRDAAYRDANSLIGADINNATGADQFNATQQLQALLANLTATNSGNQFNAGQQNQLDQAQIGAAAQRDAAGMGASASMYGANMGYRSNMLDAAAQFAQMGLGSDLNAATLRGNTAQQLMAFGQGGMGAAGTAGQSIYDQPMSNLSWYGSMLGGMPGANSGTSNTTSTSPGDGTNPWVQGLSNAAMMYMMYSGGGG